MRYSREHKSTTRRRILASAHRLFATRGYDATSIDEIMRDCGLTRGGFYAHFRSKSQLYREVGALAIAHTTDDAALRGKLLASCMETAQGLLEEPVPPHRLTYFWSVA